MQRAIGLVTEVYGNLVFMCFCVLFLGYAGEPELNQRLRENLCHLPFSNHNILSYLIHFLCRVAAHSQSNHMPVENLATIFGPCIFQ